MYKQDFKQLCDSNATYSDKTAFVTGSTSGIGREVAIALADLGMTVHIHGRDETAATELQSEIVSNCAGSAVIHTVDFSDLSAVHTLGESLQSELDSLDVLINNAGGYFRHQTPKSDIQYTFKVNHLSHFILTYYLQPVLRSGTNPHIVSTASEAHQGGKKDYMDSIQSQSNGWPAYCNSKLANIQFIKYLNSMYQQSQINITVHSVHPGGIPNSGFLRNFPKPIQIIGSKLHILPFLNTPKDGAKNILYAYLSTDLSNVSGGYIKNMDTAVPSDLAINRSQQEKLWNISEELTDISWTE